MTLLQDLVELEALLAQARDDRNSIVLLPVTTLASLITTIRDLRARVEELECDMAIERSVGQDQINELTSIILWCQRRLHPSLQPLVTTMLEAKVIEAGTATTTEIGVVHESADLKGFAPKSPSSSHEGK